MVDLNFLSIAEASKLIKARKISPADIVEAALSRVEEIDQQLNAFVTVTADLALKQAKEAEQEIAQLKYRGPLHGIPIGLKDIYSTAGILTSAGSRIYANNFLENDATVAKKLHHAGAVLLGKLMTHEFAHGGPCFTAPWPPSRNP